MEGVVTVRAERMVITKPVASKLLTPVYKDRPFFFFGHLETDPCPA